MSRRRRDARRSSKRPSLQPAPSRVELVHQEPAAWPVVDVELPAPEPPPELLTLTVAQLRARAAERGITLGKARTKAAIIEALSW